MFLGMQLVEMPCFSVCYQLHATSGNTSIYSQVEFRYPTANFSFE